MNRLDTDGPRVIPDQNISEEREESVESGIDDLIETDAQWKIVHF